ncbi:alanine racemase [Catenovulum agarivorans DS-2]|uniref:Alanine racemase n=1 Tax=Catenovulum agarivorans DS-2 TaxID=1328313 RepID=W7QGL5_9ALTE|nr:alanine racemase [Catenovulum agarivorans]EWH12059.1 alanine racemase [Catenovulum agarivorans DS-2]
MTTAVAHIKLAALAHNLKIAQQAAANSKVIAVCKANGYGHGLVETATAFKNADCLGVARIEEALQLRQAHISQPIVLLEGIFSAQELIDAEQKQLIICIHQQWQLDIIKQHASGKKLTLWLKVDTGMTRLGFAVNEIPAIIEQIAQMPQINKQLCLLSHFACADEFNHPSIIQQIQNFEFCKKQAIKTANNFGLELTFSMANSAGSLTLPDCHYDYIRPGIMLYGVSPIPNKVGKHHNLLPVMQLTSKLISIKAIPARTSVGYGATWQSHKHTHIGVVAIGYGDGYPRHAKNGTPVWINGRVVPIVGRVSMDMITVDLGENPQEKIGDTVELWGDNLPIEHVAEYSSTIAYELLCQITARVEKKYYSSGN